eukprot:364686-Chlamydomonas_euryale.AAC.1
MPAASGAAVGRGIHGRGGADAAAAGARGCGLRRVHTTRRRHDRAARGVRGASVWTARQCTAAGAGDDAGVEWGLEGWNRGGLYPPFSPTLPFALFPSSPPPPQSVCNCSYQGLDCAVNPPVPIPSFSSPSPHTFQPALNAAPLTLVPPPPHFSTERAARLHVPAARRRRRVPEEPPRGGGEAPQLGGCVFFEAAGGAGGVAAAKGQAVDGSGLVHTVTPGPRVHTVAPGPRVHTVTPGPRVHTAVSGQTICFIHTPTQALVLVHPSIS